MPIERRERPQCRKVIDRLIAERGCTLEALIEGDEKYKLGKAVRVQVRKMIEEKGTGQSAR